MKDWLLIFAFKYLFGAVSSPQFIRFFLQLWKLLQFLCALHCGKKTSINSRLRSRPYLVCSLSALSILDFITFQCEHTTYYILKNCLELVCSLDSGHVHLPAGVRFYFQQKLHYNGDANFGRPHVDRFRRTVSSVENLPMKIVDC